jgi:hypothetical protein
MNKEAQGPAIASGEKQAPAMTPQASKKMNPAANIASSIGSMAGSKKLDYLDPTKGARETGKMLNKGFNRVVDTGYKGAQTAGKAVKTALQPGKQAGQPIQKNLTNAQLLEQRNQIASNSPIEYVGEAIGSAPQNYWNSIKRGAGSALKSLGRPLTGK